MNCCVFKNRSLRKSRPFWAPDRLWLRPILADHKAKATWIEWLKGQAFWTEETLILRLY